MSDKIREKFEAWFENMNHCKPEKGFIHGGHHYYLHQRVEDAWCAWQAALSQQPAPAAVPEPDQLPTDAMLDNMRRRGLSIDGDNAYKRDLIDCIIGTLMLGKQGINPPPAGHWAQQFWEMARAEGEIQESLAAASPTEPTLPAQEPAEVYAVRYLSHWNGEGDDVYVLAWKHDGELVTHEGGVKISDLLEYQDDKILNVWPLYTATPAAEQPDIVPVPREALERAREIIEWISCRADVCPKDMRKLEESASELRALLGKENNHA
jgi:hypothetical protein